MPGELAVPLIGHDVIDSLRDLQLAADGILDHDQKIDRVRKALSVIVTEELDQEFMLSSSLVLAESPDEASDEQLFFDEGCTFIGQPKSCAYLLDYSVPVDCLTLNFLEPKVIGVDDEEDAFLRTFMFQVPVLAIDSCIRTADM